MFKKLFLSLLILSALASEGQLNIAEYIINPQFCENLGLNNLMDCEVLPVNERVLSARKDAESTVLISDANFSKYTSLSEDNRDGIRPAVIGDYNCYLNLYISYLQKFKTKGVDPFISKDICLHMSDLSPPCEKI
ncbi:MAG: hypothetical protein GX383_06850 [Clostridium sp.]|jgi:hypothetical protein|nr:hypothetical protein [Clostridium sp.]